MASELEVLRKVDFDWTLHMDSVWIDSDYHVPALHEALRQELLEQVEQTGQSPFPLSPLGRVIIGPAGAGKTHLLGALRRSVLQQGQRFVLVDMTDVRDFWETVLLGYLSSLQQSLPDGRIQFQAVLEPILTRMLKAADGRKMLRDAGRARAGKLAEFAQLVIDQLKLRYPRAVDKLRQHQDVLRALLLLNSEDNLLADIGYSWLAGLELEPDARRQHRFSHAQRKAIDIVRGLSWLMGLHGATLLALDQLDAIVSEHDLAVGERGQVETDEQRAALSIIEGLAGGMMALRDVTQRTVTVVSCLEESWNVLERRSLRSSMDRFAAPLTLKSVGRADIAREIVSRRLEAAFSATHFPAPYPTWPFRPEAFGLLADNMPRHILKLCDQHRRRCLEAGRVGELQSFEGGEAIAPATAPMGLEALDRRYQALKSAIDAQPLLAEKQEDQALAGVLQAGCRCLVKERDIPDDVDVYVDEEFPGAKSYPSLHARIRLVYRKENDRERHFSFRGLQRSHPIAYQNRLKAAMTAAGIDSKLGFRHLVLVRRASLPTGAVSQRLTSEFQQRGGVLVDPTDEDLRVLGALMALEAERPDGFEPWLRSRRPASSTEVMRAMGLAVSAADSPTSAREEESLPSSREPPPTPSLAESPARPRQAAAAVPPWEFQARLPVGRRLMTENQSQEAVTIPLAALSKHTAILAGAGSGKTVLVRRLVEEAALLGVPSIVIDAANDLSRLGDPWPPGTRGPAADELARAQAYHRKAEVIVWTPGREKGNPFFLDPIPDFAGVLDDPDELQVAVEMAQDALQDLLASGSSVKAQKKQGVLAAALKYFASHEGRQLAELVALFSDLPAEAGGGIGDAPKMASEMADQLRAAMEKNPLLGGGGAALDPGRLLSAAAAGRTRISVVNFVGLPRLESQQEFLNRLAMTLFSWVKKHPAPPQQPLQGLLVIDEAKDFIPSGQSAPCRRSLLRLSAQARKYGLGLVFATQAPKSVDHNVIANCSTQFFGRVNSPAAIEVVQGQLRQRGGTGDDVARLDSGTFYLWTEGMAAPLKLRAPLCLSHHPPTPLDEAGVLARAEASRARLLSARSS
jgi:predicted ATPase